MSTRFLFYVRAIISYLHQQQRRRRRAAPFAGLFPGLKFFRFGKKMTRTPEFFFGGGLKNRRLEIGRNCVFLVPDFLVGLLNLRWHFQVWIRLRHTVEFRNAPNARNNGMFFVCVYLKRESLTRGRNTNLRLHCLFLLRFLGGQNLRRQIELSGCAAGFLQSLLSVFFFAEQLRDRSD